MNWLVVATLASGCGRIAFEAAPDGGRAPDAVPFDPALCPASYTTTLVGSSNLYRNNPGSALWLDAEANCVSESPGNGVFTHLVVLNNSDEQTSVAQLRNFTQNWIGLSDRQTETLFIAVTAEDVGGYGTTGTPAWQMNEPNNQGNDEDCGELDPTAHLNDNSCSNQIFPYVCECDAYPADPTRY